MAAILTLSGSWDSKVRITVSEAISGRFFIGKRFTFVTPWSLRASSSSSSPSAIGRWIGPNMTPFLLLAELFGREQMTGRFAILSKLSSFFCWSRSIGVTDRSPPLSTIASLGLPTVLPISSWINFLEEVGTSLKLNYYGSETCLKVA